jgi:mono/diheme cytochrome c family protein
MKFKVAIFALLGCAGLAVSQDTTKSVWDGVYTDGQAQRGQGAYNGNCASCHGDLLTGGEMAPPLAGGEFMSNWNGLTVGDLFERIRTTMPAGKPGKLTREMNADIVAYMLSFNKFPSGSSDLPRATEVLKQIKLEAEKPAKK